MNKRKFLGTIIGVIFWTMCIVFFTYAYYEWKSLNTVVSLTIQDLATKCIKGPNVNVDDIGPVFNSSDGVAAEFSLENGLTTTQSFGINLNITSISDNLLVNSFKYMLVLNDDYTSPVVSGNFSNFAIGENVIKSNVSVSANDSASYKFIVYIDGNMYNNPNMQNNSMKAYLELGNCGIIEDVNMMKTLFTSFDVDDLQSLNGPLYNEYFKKEEYNSFIKNAYFVDYIDVSNAVEYWDVSVKEDSSIIAWVNANQTQGYYDLYIGSDKKIFIESLTAFFCNLNPLDEDNFGAMVSLENVSFDNLDVRYSKDMSLMFAMCSSLTSLDLSSFDTSNVANMYSMFTDCNSLTTLDVSNFNTVNVENMALMFSGCSNLTSLDLSGFDTSNVVDFSAMFQNCNSLTSLDLSNFDTTNVIDMSFMFNGCSNLTSLDLSNFDTTNVIDMSQMFQSCSGLTSLNVSNFDTSNVTNVSRMFQNCNNLTSLNISNFDTSNVINMSFMFNGCSGLTSLDLSNFDTINVTNMLGLFVNCNNLSTTINVTNPNITSYDKMFENAATIGEAQIIVNYTNATSALVDNMIATKSTNSNVEKGTLLA